MPWSEPLQRSDVISAFALLVAAFTFYMNWWRGRQYIGLELQIGREPQYKNVDGRKVRDQHRPWLIEGTATVYNKTRATVHLASNFHTNFETGKLQHAKHPAWSIPAGETKVISIKHHPDWSELLEHSQHSNVTLTWSVSASSQSCRFCRVGRKVQMQLSTETIKANTAITSL